MPRGIKPYLKSEEKRTNTVTLRFSELELQAIKDLHQNELPDHPFSTYIRNKLVSLTQDSVIRLEYRITNKKSK